MLPVNLVQRIPANLVATLPNNAVEIIPNVIFAIALPEGGSWTWTTAILRNDDISYPGVGDNFSSVLFTNIAVGTYTLTLVGAYSVNGHTYDGSIPVTISHGTTMGGTVPMVDRTPTPTTLESVNLVVVNPPGGGWSWGNVALYGETSIYGSGSGGDTIFFYNVPPGNYYASLDGYNNNDGHNWSWGQEITIGGNQNNQTVSTVYMVDGGPA